MSMEGARGGPGLPGAGMLPAQPPWRRGVAHGIKRFFSDQPFGDRLSEEEFAFCLLLIAAHL